MTARVTVVTPTLPQRHEKLLRACESVRAQSFTDWLHLIVPNGPGQEIPWMPQVRVAPLGRPHGTPGHWNRVLAGLLCETDLIAYLDDDNTWRPNHLEVLVAALDADPSVGFAFGRMQRGDGSVLGSPDLRETGALNHLDASMIVHRTELLADVATWDPHTAPQGLAYAMDGVLADRWLRAGVGFTFVDAITCDYPAIGYWVDGGGAHPPEVVRLPSAEFSAERIAPGG